MTGLCHESTAAISEAAAWFAANRHLCERPIIPALRQRFNLTPKQACEALAEATRKGGADERGS